MPYLLHHPKIPLLRIGIKPNPQQSNLGMMEQVWDVMPHFEAHKKFYNESDLLFLVHHRGRLTSNLRGVRDDINAFIEKNFILV